MDFETENRIAAILLKEAAELRWRAEKEGVEVYLRQPTVRGRPNSRFLASTVHGVQQANRAVEENEMWRARQKELDLDDQLRGRLRDKISNDESYRRNRNSGRTSKRQNDVEADVSPSFLPRNRLDEGLRDDEVEQFLHSRIKRGRGAVGSRMDETGPYLPSRSDAGGKQLATLELDHTEGPERVILGPEMPSSLRRCKSAESSPERKSAKRARSSEQCSKKHRSKDKSRDKEKRKKKTREEKRRKRHK